MVWQIMRAGGEMCSSLIRTRADRSQMGLHHRRYLQRPCSRTGLVRLTDGSLKRILPQSPRQALDADSRTPARCLHG